MIMCEHTCSQAALRKSKEMIITIDNAILYDRLMQYKIQMRRLLQ